MCTSEPFVVMNKQVLKKTFVWCQTQRLARKPWIMKPAVKDTSMTATMLRQDSMLKPSVFRAASEIKSPNQQQHINVGFCANFKSKQLIWNQC